jgi:ABC-type multidrug transport system ATPase subunit
MIEAVHLGAASRDGKLWEDISITVDEGDVWVVTGPASSGKSLFLKMLRGARRPDAGDILAGGKSLYHDGRSVDSFRSRSGFVPEVQADGPGWRVGNLFDLASMASPGVSAKERREREAQLLSMIGLPGGRDLPLSSLSTSERARVALAVELFRGPKYLFTDSLVAGAGPEWTDRLGGLVRALAREGAAVVLAERSLPERWAPGDVGTALGPFRLYRLEAGGGKAP